MGVNLSYDGHGFNDQDDEYKCRVLTFSKSVSDVRRKEIAEAIDLASKLKDAAMAALIQMEQAQSMFEDDEEFNSALNDLKDALGLGDPIDARKMKG